MKQLNKAVKELYNRQGGFTLLETLIAVAKPFDARKAEALRKAGAEVVELAAERAEIDLAELLVVLGRRQVTSVLVEGGNKLFGSLFDRGLVDKVLAFVSPIIIGGDQAKSAVGGQGVGKVAEALCLSQARTSEFGDDVLISGYLAGK